MRVEATRAIVEPNIEIDIECWTCLLSVSIPPVLSRRYIMLSRGAVVIFPSVSQDDPRLTNGLHKV